MAVSAPILTWGERVDVDALAAPAERDWAGWAEAQDPPARFLTVWSGPQVHGFDSPIRFGGVMFQPAEVVLGIRAWDDAHEGVIELEAADARAPWALFEVEKIVRMMLHQSGLAFEILASPAVFYESRAQDFPARRVVEAAVTRQVVAHYRDVAAGLIERMLAARFEGVGPTDLLDLFRQLLTGWALCDGVVEFDLWRLVERRGDDALRGKLREVQSGAKVDADMWAELDESARELLAAIEPDTADGLPEQPSDYGWLNDLVVESRSNAQAPNP